MANVGSEKMKLAVLTSGGDSAGMNAVVRAVVKAGILRYHHLPLHCTTYLTLLYRILITTDRAHQRLGDVDRARRL